MEDFNKIYSEFLEAVENKIQEYLADKKPDCMYDPFRYIMSAGGKRIRPVLTMISAGAVGGDPYSAVDIAAAIEIMHNFTLVHDDIMDQSPIRRGRDTVHIKWDPATAIIAGDVMVGHGYSLLPERRNHERADDINREYTKGLIEVCEGQAYDMKFNEDKDVRLEDYFMMIEKKTSLLLETAAVMGGHAGHGNIDEVEALRTYAKNIGLAFQIQDDLLDLTAEQEKLGKKIGQDILEGKKTYLILKAKEKLDAGHGNKNDKELMQKFYDENGLSEEYVPAMNEMFERLNVIEEAYSEAEKLLGIASKSLKAINDNKYTEMLKELLNKLNKRKY